jgi:hypothetical protein
LFVSLLHYMYNPFCLCRQAFNYSKMVFLPFKPQLKSDALSKEIVKQFTDKL